MRLLVLNCHEPWIYQLRCMDADLDLVVDLPGRKVSGWDFRMRPLPPRSRTLTLGEALSTRSAEWDAVVCHNITDLMDTAAIDAPRLLILHETLDGRMAAEGADFDRNEMIAMLRTYITQLGAHAVAVTAAKGASWGVAGKPLHCAADPDDYLAPSYEHGVGLRVANQVATKKAFLAWDFHEQAFGGLPVRLVGHNPQVGIEAADNWDHLKQLFASHRFFVHTADPRYEDGFNMAMVEAMAAGLPVISNAHPTSPLTHGVDGFIAATPGEARGYAERLIADASLARTMGGAARRTVVSRFSPHAFRLGMREAISRARKRYVRRQRVFAAA